MTTEDEINRRVREARQLLKPALADFVRIQMQARHGPDWRRNASRDRRDVSSEALDSHALLMTMLDNWKDVFGKAIDRKDFYKAETFAATVLEARNAQAHENDIADDDGLRFLGAHHGLARCIKATEGVTCALKRLYDEQRMSGLLPAPRLGRLTSSGDLRRKKRGSRDRSGFREFLVTNYKKEGDGGHLASTSAASYCSFLNNIENLLPIDLDQENLTAAVVDSIIDRLRASCNSHGVPAKYISDWSSGLRAYAIYRMTVL